jgi:hypothetical protein
VLPHIWADVGKEPEESAKRTSQTRSREGRISGDQTEDRLSKCHGLERPGEACSAAGTDELFPWLDTQLSL